MQPRHDHHDDTDWITDTRTYEFTIAGVASEGLLTVESRPDCIHLTVQQQGTSPVGIALHYDQAIDLARWISDMKWWEVAEQAAQR